MSAVTSCSLLMLTCATPPNYDPASCYCTCFPPFNFNSNIHIHINFLLSAWLHLGSSSCSPKASSKGILSLVWSDYPNLHRFFTGSTLWEKYMLGNTWQSHTECTSVILILPFSCIYTGDFCELIVWYNVPSDIAFGYICCLMVKQI